MTPAHGIEFADQVASNAANITINQFQKYLAEGSLVLRPAFQRNLVWNRQQKSFLIDSILRGLPVPELYVQSLTSADGDEEIIVVDGQQRISSCLQFLSGELRLTSEADLDPRWRARKFVELEDELRGRFRSYELIARKLPDLGEDVLREVFRRLNKTVEPLTPQELRHAAYTGEFIQFVEAAAAQTVLGEVGVFTAKDYLRRRSDELMAEIAHAVISDAFPNKKDGLDELFLTYERQGIPEAVLAEVEMKFGRVFAQLTKIAGPLRRTRFRNKSDFYSLFVALTHSAERLPLDEADSDALVKGLRSFSDAVNDVKREENEARPGVDPEAQSSVDAARYLRAVERAASDRQNRVRRNDVLVDILAPLLTPGLVRELVPGDSGWLRSGDEAADDEDDDEYEAEKAHTEEVLRAG